MNKIKFLLMARRKRRIELPLICLATVLFLTHQSVAQYDDPIIFPAGNTTHGIASGDFNGDDIPDLVACNQFGNNATVVLGSGGGSFDTPYAVSVGSQPYFVVADDFNNDGLDDFVVSNFESNLATIRLGTTDGAFSAPTSYPTGNGTNFPAGTGVWYLQTADLNNDGNKDLVTANVRHEFVSVMLGNGSGGFSSPLITDVGPVGAPSDWSNQGPYEMAIADFNLDGNEDVAVSILGYTDGQYAAVRILTGDGNGGLTVTTSYTDPNEIGVRPRGITANDFNGDGLPDLMFNNHLSGLPQVCPFAGIGDGTFNVHAPVEFPVDALYTVTSGDLNNDGHIDLLAGEQRNGSSPVNVWRALGNGDGTFRTPEAIVMDESDRNPIYTILVDLDNNGCLDIATALNSGAIAVRLSNLVCESVDIVPDSYRVTRGAHVFGGTLELGNSDDAVLSIQRAPFDVQSRTEFEVESVSPVALPSSMEVTLEGSVFARSQVNQTIELFDYVAGDWEQVDTRQATRFTDSTVTVAATGNLSRFVQQNTMAIEARIRYQSPVARQRFASNTDQFIWTIGQ